MYLGVRLHEIRVVAVRLRHQQHQRLGWLHACAHQQLCHIVQVGLWDHDKTEQGLGK